ncbi:hypothetical protein AALP_AA6G032300 [Arabis alpina]|uniref:Phorbol-ester/DAG-type domain-containing protein n=1 Tax=Arabis alpina TaxID=50452 RepID=A0A087GLT7_ARAAL|nr:hypothetical protein AALP_AA6G032300 [Arabis alpina]
MESEGVSLPWIHKHLMMPWNHLGKGNCCGRIEAITDGYFCEKCNYFVHKKCGDETSEYIEHPSHTGHTLQLQSDTYHHCDLCGTTNENLFYRCEICDFNMDLFCAKYPPPEVIEASETHHHKLTLLKQRIMFDCGAKCGKRRYGYPYKCDECDLAFHVDCVWHPIEVKHPIEYITMEAGERVSLPWIHRHFMLPWNDLRKGDCCGRCEAITDGYYCKRCGFFVHKKCGEEAPESIQHPSHSLHPLWLQITPNNTSCDLCGKTIVDLSYRCKICDFDIDLCCVKYQPPEFTDNSEMHDHKLTFFKNRSKFNCDANCGKAGEKEFHYKCDECNLAFHVDCVWHPPEVEHSSEVDWTCGGYSCKRCPGYIVHSKCATRGDVWNGKELEGVPEEIEDIEPYVVIDENTINHFSHKEHNLRLQVNGVQFEENKRCSACIHPIGLQSFYGCINCDFVLHQNCAECPKKKWHVVHNEQLTLATREGNYFVCNACGKISSGFVYKDGKRKLDVRCSSVSEPYVHTSHPLHPLYYIPPNRKEICNGCNLKESHVLRCIEDGCEFVLGFKCATLPQVVKHRVNDHPLLLCYGEEEVSGKYWCDICEKESDPRVWFYTCKDNHACLHTKCVLGDLAGLMPSNTIIFWGRSCEVVLNNCVTRPVCRKCKSRCIYPNILKELGTSDTYCSYLCLKLHMMYGERERDH